MEITTPTQDIKLPADIQKAIENGRNQVTILEAEKVRLQGLINSLGYTVIQLHNEKNELDTQIPSLKEALNKLNIEIKTANDERDSAILNYKNLELSIKNLESDIQAKTVEFSNTQNKLKSDIAAFNKEKEMFNEQKAFIERKEKELDGKMSALKGIIG